MFRKENEILLRRKMRVLSKWSTATQTVIPYTMCFVLPSRMFTQYNIEAEEIDKNIKYIDYVMYVISSMESQCFDIIAVTNDGLAWR